MNKEREDAIRKWKALRKEIIERLLNNMADGIISSMVLAHNVGLESASKLARKHLATQLTKEELADFDVVLGKAHRIDKCPIDDGDSEKTTDDKDHDEVFDEYGIECPCPECTVKRLKAHMAQEGEQS